MNVSFLDSTQEFIHIATPSELTIIAGILISSLFTITFLSLIFSMKANKKARKLLKIVEKELESDSQQVNDRSNSIDLALQTKTFAKSEKRLPTSPHQALTPADNIPLNLVKEQFTIKSNYKVPQGYIYYPQQNEK